MRLIHKEENAPNTQSGPPEPNVCKPLQRICSGGEQNTEAIRLGGINPGGLPGGGTVLGREENCSWGQPVLGSNLVSGWESLNEASGISEPRSWLSGDTHPASQPPGSVRQACVACTAVCSCPAFEKPGDTKSGKCSAQRLALTVDDYESRARVADGFGGPPPGEGEVSQSGKCPLSPELSDTGSGDPRRARLVFSGGGTVSFDRCHTPRVPCFPPWTLSPYELLPWCHTCYSLGGVHQQ